ncbi:conserved hypothetical protein [Ricinus communis]|uniref:Uncharacterized protein n=1 Tax=Ricinus communis TaxID=3988 RepID=B9RW68_RICCO|nr:conserved hypothetical protein [Ricinus communis]
MLDRVRGFKLIPELHLIVRGLHANDCSSLESINLKNFLGESTLGCINLKEIAGFFNLEPIRADVAEKPLGRNSSFIQGSSKNSPVPAANMMCPLQALCERGTYSIFQPGDDAVSVLVPQLDPGGSSIIGVVTRATYSWRRSSDSCFSFPRITITNKPKCLNGFAIHISLSFRVISSKMSAGRATGCLIIITKERMKKMLAI